MQQQNNASLTADILLLTVGPEALDFEVKFEPKNIETTHKGERVSTVQDSKYLYRMADFNDWSADGDERQAQEAKDSNNTDLQRTKEKNARYSRNRAAVCRYYARKLTYTNGVTPSTPF